ncbi:NADH-quinone oxidoreductase subunit C [Leptospira perolatii]|uniref:NADH-quinone oxidoreductase subunit J n=1 Tax=Leptospira perolatii TaxID=2023191 RepID=A0A2M9ZKD8_9LEPT|nr:NADH-quinone oxidoreductase subunit J [Leptospira perolatii]PJZ69373.1 NADH-quinone oxidoreductase subunit C [Leptospira perolatii]PJZ72508.1 NADH-quinone oxidoreductase subunit C [Leptospira perolatii]
MAGIFDQPQLLLFFVFAGILIAGSLGVVFHPNPISSAILLVLAFFALGGIYAVMGSIFIATMQVLVYAGAIMVLVVFVLMLLSLHDEGVTHLWKNPIKKSILLGFVAILGVLLVNAVREGVPHTALGPNGYGEELHYRYSIPNSQAGESRSGSQSSDSVDSNPMKKFMVPSESNPLSINATTQVNGNTAVVGSSMFLEYLLPFEIVSVLLLAAVLGAVILGKKNLGKKDEDIGSRL